MIRLALVLALVAGALPLAAQDLSMFAIGQPLPIDPPPTATMGPFEADKRTPGADHVFSYQMFERSDLSVHTLGAQFTVVSVSSESRERLRTPRPTGLDHWIFHQTTVAQTLAKFGPGMTKRGFGPDSDPYFTTLAYRTKTAFVVLDFISDIQHHGNFISDGATDPKLMAIWMMSFDFARSRQFIPARLPDKAIPVINMQ